MLRAKKEKIKRKKEKKIRKNKFDQKKKHI